MPDHKEMMELYGKTGLQVPPETPEFAEPEPPAPVQAEPAPVQTEPAPVQTEPAPAEAAPVEAPAPVQAAPSPQFDELMELCRRQADAIQSLSRQLDEMKKQLEKPAAPPPATGTEYIPALVNEVKALKEAGQKQEKANTDILRDSKNFQATVWNTLQKELEAYRKIHAETAQASLLTDVGNAYIMAARAIGFLEEGKTKTTLTELILETLQELLEDKGVEMNTTPVGQPRSLKRCKTLKTIPTGNKDLQGTVAHSYNPSFVLGNMILIKENIDTYLYDEALDESLKEEAPPAEEAPAADVPAEEAPAVEEALPAQEAPAAEEALPVQEAPAAEEIPASPEA